MDYLKHHKIGEKPRKYFQLADKFFLGFYNITPILEGLSRGLTIVVKKHLFTIKFPPL